MNNINGDRLNVNLSATQTRRRLEGHGFGVKKIHSNGRNQAVVIHTATGRHRDELHALFADVIASDKTEKY
jgi:DNA transformation protein and related proteins